ncbi:hypothetical protein [Paenibacillus sp. GCM10027626]|uniref:hypothetical protein n=1 Tax=Paenibacillus sp. GCM10027626 TaxID=3273411 RepID=UPI00362D8EF3
MAEQIDEQAMLQYIADRTKADIKSIQQVLKHEEAFIGKAKANAQGEVDIDSDELVDYVLSRPDIKLTEIMIDAILEAEMDYLTEQGLAGDID